MTRQVNEPLKHPPGWAKAPAGSVGRVRDRLRAARRRRVFLKASAAALGTAAAGLFGGWLYLFSEPALGFTCADVKDHAEAFHQGRLSASQRDRFANHLASCSRCRDIYGACVASGDDHDCK